ncbi:MAG: hypothetical protein NTZ81_11080 [Actinobacteria bacterium]|nr:hypothetical protein [Actinomycetota bacterium]
MAERPARQIAFIERHPRWWPDIEAAAEELLRATEADSSFLLVDGDR